MIPDQYLLFVIIIIMTYILEDSFIALIAIAFFSFAITNADLTAIKTSNDPGTVIYVYLDIIAVMYSSLSVYYWTFRRKKENENNHD